jgi:hypothetical protein
MAFTFLRRLVSIVVLIPSIAVAQSAADEVRCNYTKRQVCDAKGCRDLPIADNYLLSPDLGAFSVAMPPQPSGEPVVSVRRCDRKRCSSVEVVSAKSGAFLNVWKPDGGYMLRFVYDAEGLVPAARRGDFVEVATALLTTYVSYGRCPTY